MPTASPGNDGDNFLFGLSGWDGLSGGGGDDWLEGGDGQDSLSGGDGNDTVSYAGSSAGVTATIGGNNSGGDAYRDSIQFNVENISGSRFTDVLTGSVGANVLSGLDGNDALKGGIGADRLDGGSGTDTASYLGETVGVRVDLSTGTGSRRQRRGRHPDLDRECLRLRRRRHPDRQW